MKGKNRRTNKKKKGGNLLRRRSVAIPANCRLWFNHWEIHPVRVLGLHKLTLKDAAQRRRIKLGIFLAVLFSPATAAPSPRFLASSALLSFDAYSSTRPVCIYTGMFVCCWFTIPIRPTGECILLHFSCGRSPAPIPPSPKPPSSSRPQSHASTAIDPPEESRRRTQRFLACLLRLTLFPFFHGFSLAMENLCTLDISSVICLIFAFVD